MAQDYKERARKREAERKQSVWYKLAEGDNTFRMLPTPQGKHSQQMFYEYAVHRDVGPKKVQVRCGKNMEGEGDCWLCDSKIPKLHDAGQDARAAALEPRDVFMVQVAKVDPDAETFAGPYLMTPSKTIADGLLRLIGSKKKKYEDPESGRNITVSRTGTGRNDTRYGAIEIDEDPTEVPEEIIKKLKPFDQLKEIPVYSEGAQKAAYQGIDYVEPEDDEEEAPVRRKKTAPVPDDEGEPEEDVTDDSVDDIDDEPPAKPKKKKAVVEDDDDDEPAPKPKKKQVVDDDDDEPAPKPKKKVVVEDDDEPPVKSKKKAAVVEDDDLEDLNIDDLDDIDMPPAKPKKKAVVDDDDDEPAPKPKKKQVVDDDEPAPKPKKKAVVEDDDDEPAPKPKKKVSR